MQLMPHVRVPTMMMCHQSLAVSHTSLVLLRDHGESRSLQGGVRDLSWGGPISGTYSMVMVTHHSTWFHMRSMLMVTHHSTHVCHVDGKVP